MVNSGLQLSRLLGFEHLTVADSTIIHFGHQSFAGPLGAKVGALPPGEI